MTTPPQHIRFLADGEEVELIDKPGTLKPNSKDDLHWYKYIVSKEKIGRELPMTLEYINKLIAFNLLQIL